MKRVIFLICLLIMLAAPTATFAKINSGTMDFLYVQINEPIVGPHPWTFRVDDNKIWHINRYAKLGVTSYIWFYPKSCDMKTGMCLMQPQNAGRRPPRNIHWSKLLWTCESKNRSREIASLPDLGLSKAQIKKIKRHKGKIIQIDIPKEDNNYRLIWVGKNGMCIIKGCYEEGPNGCIKGGNTFIVHPRRLRLIP